MGKNASQRASNTHSQKEKEKETQGEKWSAWIKDKNESKPPFNHHHHLNKDGPQAFE